MKTLPLLYCMMLALFVGSAHSQDTEKKKQPRTIVDELGFKGFNIFKEAVTKSEWAEKFKGTEEFTVLAPTDVAFRDLPKVQLDALMADPQKLKSLVENHLIAGKFSSADLKTTPQKTLAGTTPEVKVVDGKIKVQGATMVKPDIAAPGGMIHGIDKLLFP